jgi:hypothetical protein
MTSLAGRPRDFFGIFPNRRVQRKKLALHTHEEKLPLHTHTHTQRKLPLHTHGESYRFAHTKKATASHTRRETTASHTRRETTASHTRRETTASHTRRETTASHTERGYRFTCVYTRIRYRFTSKKGYRVGRDIFIGQLALYARVLDYSLSMLCDVEFTSNHACVKYLLLISETWITSLHARVYVANFVVK